MIAEQLQLFDFAPVLIRAPFVWINSKNAPCPAKYCEPETLPFSVEMITGGNRSRIPFRTFAEAKEWASLRIEQSAANDDFKLIIWRSNVELWHHPAPRAFDRAKPQGAALS